MCISNAEHTTFRFVFLCSFETETCQVRHMNFKFRIQLNGWWSNWNYIFVFRSRFLLFTLLVPFVHREGSIGQQARDALLLCMSLSKKNDLVGAYITENSNVCPVRIIFCYGLYRFHRDLNLNYIRLQVLATGLNGLYSLLPRKLEIETEDWHRLTPDDINELPELTHFINSFEFCNAIAQVSFFA